MENVDEGDIPASTEPAVEQKKEEEDELAGELEFGSDNERDDSAQEKEGKRRVMRREKSVEETVTQNARAQG